MGGAIRQGNGFTSLRRVYIFFAFRFLFFPASFVASSSSTSQDSRFAYLAPFSPPGVTPAARAEMVVCGEVEVDSGAIEG